MKTVQISLNSIDKVKSFVNTITKYDNDFDLVSGRYVIDAKSIMGIFSLDLSKPINLNIHAEGSMLDTILKQLLCIRMRSCFYVLWETTPYCLLNFDYFCRCQRFFYKLVDLLV